MPKPIAPVKGADWTRLLADPDLVTHLGELLQTYRDAPAETREQALLELMRKIKRESQKGKTSAPDALPTAEAIPAEVELPVAEAAAAPEAKAPPYEPSIFTPAWGQDRRRYPRMKCFVVVELRVVGSDKPLWGNLSNASIGGCLVETSAMIDAGASIEIGLWVTSGQIWVKGMILNGIVARTNPSLGVRVQFADLEPAERETLRQFLKFVETSTKGYSADHGYLAQLKR